MFVPAAGIEPALPRLVCFGRTVTGGCYLIQRPTSWPLVHIATFYILSVFSLTYCGISAVIPVWCAIYAVSVSDLHIYLHRAAIYALRVLDSPRLTGVYIQGVPRQSYYMSVALIPPRYSCRCGLGGRCYAPNQPQPPHTNRLRPFYQVKRGQYLLNR